MVVFIVLNVTSPINPQPLLIVPVDDGVIAGVLVGVGVNDCMPAFTYNEHNDVEVGVGVMVGVEVLVGVGVGVISTSHSK
jgi:hypothetical protein